MASELNHLILTYLEQLPSGHPDRRFLEGIQEAVAGYVDQAIGMTEAQPEAPVVGQTAIPDAEPASRPERRTVRGRVAAPPDFKTLPRGSRRGHFPLAEHPDTETTTYWDVYTWNKPGKPWTNRLEQLGLKRGDAVEVIGFVHPVSTLTNDGKPRPAMLYAAAPVKTR